jgi:hypothetical protein
LDLVFFGFSWSSFLPALEGFLGRGYAEAR